MQCTLRNQIQGQDTVKPYSKLGRTPQSKTQFLGRTPLSQTQCWAGHRGARLNVEQDTAEPDSMLGGTPRSQTQCWAGHREVRLNVRDVVAQWMSTRL